VPVCDRLGCGGTAPVTRGRAAVSDRRSRRRLPVRGLRLGRVFRHFPTKAALLEAVLLRRFERLRDQAEGLVSAEDPGRAFFDFFSHMVADAAGKIAIAEALADAGGDAPGSVLRASGELERATEALLGRAQEAGAVRKDVGLPEVYALLIGASRAAALAHLDEDVRARAVAIVFDGLAGPPRRASG
jgi:AcrR family transcriptional regulator